MKFEIHEKPLSPSDELLSLGECASQACVEAQGLIRRAILQSSSTYQNATPKVAVALLSRVSELAGSALLLFLRDRHRDGAVLALSAYELKLDAMYIDQNHCRADLWLDHAAENRKPWSVSAQQRALFTNPSELDAERFLFRQFSMVKHCNPVAGPLAFPISFSRAKLTLDKNLSLSICPAYTFGLVLTVCSTVTAAANILQGAGIDVGNSHAAVAAIDREATRRMELQMVKVIRQLKGSG